MAKIYISSTYADLSNYRETVYRTLRQMGHDVIAMEDYVATDRRPVNKCLADVANSDLYVGIFAWRYGYVPPPEHGNPEQQSITELEYRQARNTGKPCLLFLLSEEADWPPKQMDMISGEGDAGKRIKALRGEFQQEALISVFSSPDELAKLVSVAAGNWERAQGLRPARTSGLRQRCREWLAATVFARRNTKRYLRNLVAQHQAFSFLGRAKPLQLDNLYVSLKVGEYTSPTLLPDTPEATVLDAPRDPVRDGRTVDVPETLSLSRRLVVLGDPGSGKTTLLKYLVLQLARRDPRLAPFARALIPTAPTRLLEPTCRFLSGANVLWPGLIASLTALAFWLVQVFHSESPFTASGIGLLFFVSLFLLFFKLDRKATLFGACLALVLLFYTGWWQPHLVGPTAVGLMGLSVGICLYPFWSRPPLALLRWLLQRRTRYPFPVYLTLNNLAQDTRPIEEHLDDALTAAGFPHGHRFLRRQLNRGRCLLLLDALDEVVEPGARQRVVSEINRLRTAHGERNQILVTSRIAGFPQTLSGYLQLEVQEFNQQQIEAFVRSWFADTENPEERERRVDGLQQALGRSARMRLLAGNPLLLSLMTLLYEHHWQLPERRVALYEECTGLLIADWDRLRGITRAPRFTLEQKQQALTRVAVAFHVAGTRVFGRAQLLEALVTVLPACGCGDADPGEFLDELTAHTGLLRQKSRSSYDFVHLTFQEFFTARAFREQHDGDKLLGHAGEAWWREVIRLHAGLEQDATTLIERFRTRDLFLAAGCLADCRPQDTPAFHRLVAAIVGDLQRLVQEDATRRQDAADVLAEVAAWGANPFLIDAVVNDKTQPAVALAALLALTQAMDKTMEDTLFADMGRVLRLLHGQLPRVSPQLRARILALFDRLGHPLVHVPAGDFLMGSDDASDESPRHAVTLDEYWIDTFPVTNDQFARFVQETGYQAQGDWQAERRPGKERHPVVNVTWNDARAYGEWCGKRLPTEAEWEKAARGTDGREYPWGNRWDGNKCNVSGRGTMAVGSFPEGVSPYGCHDMVGNVEEWTSSLYKAYPYHSEDGREAPEGEARRVVRGGGWNLSQTTARAAYRNHIVPGNRDNDRGFRLARSPP